MDLGDCVGDEVSMQVGSKVVMSDSLADEVCLLQVALSKTILQELRNDAEGNDIDEKSVKKDWKEKNWSPADELRAKIENTVRRRERLKVKI